MTFKARVERIQNLTAVGLISDTAEGWSVDKAVVF